MEVNYMTCFLWGITWWHSKGPVLDDPSSPWQFTEKKRKKETNTVLAQIESKFNCKREGTWHLKRTNAKPKNARNNVHLGSDLSSNWQIATSNDKAFHTPYQLSAVEFTRWCLDLWTCSKKSSCYVFWSLVHVFITIFFVCFFVFFVVWNDYKYKLSLYSSLQYTKPTTNLQQANWLTFTYPCSSLRDVSTHP